MKVAKKRAVFDAVPYEPGMEDGYYCYGITGEFLGYYSKNQYPRSRRVAIIETPWGNEPVFTGDWVFTTNSGNRFPVSKVAFEDYEPVQESKKVGTIVKVLLGGKEICYTEIPGIIDHGDVTVDLSTVEK